MDDPYQPPADAPVSADNTRRPFGVSTLAVLSGIFGLMLLGLFVFNLTNWRENNEHFLQRRMAPLIFWVLTGLTVALSLASSVGMWRGAKWSWWLACSVLVLYVLQNFGSAASIVISNGATALDMVSLLRSIRSVVLGVVFALLLRYWLGMRVRRYFQFEKAGGIKAVLGAGLGGIGIVLAITVVLQTIFMIRMRYAS
ncbi:MAG TPA: hypothetical protein VMM76_04605 [Pirellulaceae bacterium]|nr:hypothetical protein [Pirellulaceae bacterium]